MYFVPDFGHACPCELILVALSACQNIACQVLSILSILCALTLSHLMRMCTQSHSYGNLLVTKHQSKKCMIEIWYYLLFNDLSLFFKSVYDMIYVQSCQTIFALHVQMGLISNTYMCVSFQISVNGKYFHSFSLYFQGLKLRFYPGSPIASSKAT